MKICQTIFLSTLILILTAGACAAQTRTGKPRTPDANFETLAVGGVERNFLAHVPESYDGKTDVPLLLAFHGGGGNGQGFGRNSGFSEIADRENFIVVYPNSLVRWNDGRDFSVQGEPIKSDDVGFVKALVKHLRGKYKIDARRIYAAGVSNGGLFSYRLGAEMSDVLAGIAPVSASIAAPLFDKYAAPNPLAVIVFNGTEDPLIPYKGGAGARNEIYISAPASVAKWVGINNCQPKIAKTETIDRLPDDGTKVRIEKYAGCKRGADVHFYTIEGGGHGFPGKPGNAETRAGKTTQEIKAAEVIWEFFKQHPKSQAVEQK